jgi:cell wall-associated NlpC family hydrolase
LLPARRLLRALVPVGLAVGVFAAASAAQAEPTAADIQQQIEKSSSALERIVEQYNKVNEQLKTDKQRSAALATKIAPLQAQFDAASADVAQIAANAYKTGGLGAANALLGASSGGALTDRLGMLDQISKARQGQLADFTAIKQRYEAQKSELDKLIARQTAQAADLTASKKKIQSDLDKLYDLRRQAYGSATTTTAKYTGSIPAISGKAGTAVRYAYNAIGTPYVWAADGPNGYDCSGLTMAAWRAAGVSLPHNAAMQWDVVAHISRSQIKPGDLVFYNSLGHVAIYVGSGKIIEAPNAGESVKLASVDIMSPYGYGRVRA